MGPMLPKLLEGAGATIHTFIPDPAGYEKTLPPMTKVVADKDKLNLKNWGGLAEAYLFAGNKKAAESIYAEFTKASQTVFDPTETYLAAVEGDFGMVYFNDKDYAKAEPMLLDSARLMEANLTYAISNNLISNYLCLSLIKDSQGKTEEAAKYASKLVDIAKRQREKNL
jgi:tetratricopeptide (TPR) repeat protein